MKTTKKERIQIRQLTAEYRRYGEMLTCECSLGGFFMRLLDDADELESRDANESMPTAYDAEGNAVGHIRLFRCTMLICEPCLDGKGQECHTPGCILARHKVDLPIHREFLDRCEYVCNAWTTTPEFKLRQRRSNESDL